MRTACINSVFVEFKRLLLKSSIAIALVIVLSVFSHLRGEELVFESNRTSFRAVTLTDGLEHPWAMAFLPAGDLLITERRGRLLWYRDGKLHRVSGLPEIATGGQGGLLDVVRHPDYLMNKTICFAYSAGDSQGTGTEIACASFDQGHLSDLRVIFRAIPKWRTGVHFGSRLLFAPDGYLYATLGDRGYRFFAQDTSAHPGSIIRITDQGLLPPDNPLIGRENARPEIFAYGNRNPQGMSLEPGGKRIWIHEHGPRGGDELNILYPDANYGWPVVSFGKEYWSNKSVGEGTHKAGMQQPVYYWVPSIAPSGMTFYQGEKFPNWQGSLFIGSLKFKLLVRLELEGNRVVTEERLLADIFGRIRDVREGPDGLLYLLTDEKNGKLVRLETVD